ncbi:MAG TPA: nitrogen fixation protein NifZ, partial [Piscinibacter sp.]|nr:nitrogen fixation protein NifZ [Piscinibacter sp.]
MADIARDDDVIEIAYPPRFEMGERVVSRSVVRNDGTYNGRDIGEVLVHKGEVGFVRSIGT